MSESIFNLPLLIEARRLRLDSMRVRLPGPLWFVIVAGALISLCSTFFFRVDDPRLHRIAAAATRVWGPEHQYALSFGAEVPLSSDSLQWKFLTGFAWYF